MDETVPPSPFFDPIVIDGHVFRWTEFIAKLDRIAADFDVVWAEVDGDHPGWTYWQDRLTRFDNELADLLTGKLITSIVTEFGPNLDEEDLPYVLQRAIRLAWLTERRLLFTYLAKAEVPSEPKLHVWDLIDP